MGRSTGASSFRRRVGCTSHFGYTTQSFASGSSTPDPSSNAMLGSKVLISQSWSKSPLCRTRQRTRFVKSRRIRVNQVTRNDVLIIGAGPSGIFAAAELARHGVTARLIERHLEPHRQARATAIQPGTLEILNTVGLLRPFANTAEHVRCSRIYGPDMVELGANSHDGIDCC